MMSYPFRYGDQLDNLARILVCLSLFFLPISITLKGLIFVAVGLAIFGNQIRKYFHWLWTYKVHYVAYALLVCLLLAAFFSPYESKATFLQVIKYGEKILLPFLLLPLFVEPKWRRRIVNTLIFTTLFYCTLAFINEYRVINIELFFNKEREALLNPIPWSIYVAFTLFAIINRLIDEKHYRFLYLFFTVYILFFIFVINIERTGMLLSLSLICLIFVQRLGWRGVLFSFLLLPLLAMLVYSVSPTVKNRTHSAIVEVDQFRKGDPNILSTSVGLRLSFIIEGIKLVKERPLLGYGIGSFERLFKARPIKAPDDHTLRDPHSIYLHITLQAGLIGLAVFIIWLLAQILDSKKLPLMERRLAQGLIFTFILSGFFEDSLLHNRTLIWYIVLLLVFFSSKIELDQNIRKSV